MSGNTTARICRQIITDASAWRGADLVDDGSWIYEFSAPELEELDRALRKATSQRATLGEIDRHRFPLPTLASKLQEIRETIQWGRGFVVLRGLPVSRYSDEEVGTIFWGIGTHLGTAVYQNKAGDLLGHVFDHGRKYGTAEVRGYESTAHLAFHTDFSDAVGLLCLRQAKKGGLSSVVSATRLHNEILRSHPEHLPALYRGYHYIRREVAFSDAPVTPNRIPVFGYQDGYVSCRLVRDRVRAACQRTGKALSPKEEAALDYFDALAYDPELHLDMALQVGDMQFCNNYTILHSRTEFEDWPEPGRERHMVRLWLTMPDPRRPLPDGFPRGPGYARTGDEEVRAARELGLISGAETEALV